MTASAAAETTRDRGLRLLRDDLPLFASECLKIKDKRGEISPLRFNRLQLHLHARLEEQLRRTGRVRAQIGKGRQGGASTYVGARFYHQTSMLHGVQTYILTHEQDASDTLFNIVDRFLKHSPLRPSVGVSNAKELNFDRLDSGYAVGTAGTKATGRSKTIQRFHGSEVAFWPNAKDHFAGVVQTVPDAEGTEIILESTGHGVGGEWHERWQRADVGDGDYINIFCPWFWSDEYRRAVPPGFILDEEEAEYAGLHDLSVEQMVWRRAKISELKDPLLFKQEYPATALEMFQSSGHDSFIVPESVVRARKAQLEAVGPLVVGADPARFGDDRFSLAWRQGRVVPKIESRTKVDAVSGANWIKTVIDRDRPDKVFLDMGGIGAAVFDILASWGDEYVVVGRPQDSVVVGIDFGGDPQEPTVYMSDGEERPGPRNRRAEMWMRSRDWLDQPGGADIPDLDSLQADACAPGYSYDMSQRLLLESKERMRARGQRSPDEWDAVALTFAEPVRPKKAKAVPNVRRPMGAGRNAWLAA